MANGEWRMGEEYGRSSDQFIQGSACLAGRHDAGRAVLSADKALSEVRAVRSYVANSPGRYLGSRQYRGGAWPGEHRIVHPILARIAGFAQGAGDAPRVVGARGFDISIRDRATT